MSISRYLSYALPWSYFFFVASETWPVALDGEEESKRTDRGISLPRLASSTLVQIQPYFPPVSGITGKGEEELGIEDWKNWGSIAPINQTMASDVVLPQPNGEA
ncbi:hypothetical protein V6N11_032585 [Hibiscus sabdariffa]|uniref:Uncharacterized protein n=1 Tax=Hibiscus sabdariffa TaxID=183260 RepID=A0ABR2T128_9ROSI